MTYCLSSHFHFIKFILPNNNSNFLRWRLFLFKFKAQKNQLNHVCIKNINSQYMMFTCYEFLSPFTRICTDFKC